MDRDTRMQRIRETVCDIPPGRVASYGQVADIAGVPRGARQVGYTLRHLPDDADVPWHRVLRASGQIAFGEDSPQFERQRDLLIVEGVIVNAGRVDMARYRWRPALDELLWKPSSVWDES